MSLAGCQINLIDVNFHLQKSLDYFFKIQLKKSDPKRTSEWKVPSLMPIRVEITDVRNMPKAWRGEAASSGWRCRTNSTAASQDRRRWQRRGRRWWRPRRQPQPRRRWGQSLLWPQVIVNVLHNGFFPTLWRHSIFLLHGRHHWEHGRFGLGACPVGLSWCDHFRDGW